MISAVERESLNNLRIKQSNRKFPEYETGALTTTTWRSVQWEVIYVTG